MKYLVWLVLLVTSLAQAQTVLVGDKVSNVSGARNYVINPSAKANVANVTGSNATITRSTTTPVSEIGTEFNINITANNGTATWALNAFTNALRGLQCEARFKYRAATSTTLFQVLQGVSVIAQLTPVVDSVNTSQGTIAFPCGDLSSVTTFRVTATAATLPTALEIGDVSVAQLATVLVQAPVVAAGTGVAPLAGQIDHYLFSELTSGFTPGTGFTNTGMTVTIPTTGRYRVGMVVTPYNNDISTVQSNSINCIVTDGADVQVGKIGTQLVTESQQINQGVIITQSAERVVTLTAGTVLKIRCNKNAANDGGLLEDGVSRRNYLFAEMKMDR